VAFLEARYGDRWSELPSDMGRDGLYVEQLLADVPVTADPAVVTPDAAAATLRTLIPAASAAIELVRDGAEMLGESLGTSLVAVPLARLRRIAAATVAVGSGPTPEPAWSDPQAAALADAVLQIHGNLLTTSRGLHQQVYAAFTDHVWDVPAKKLDTRRASWPIVGIRRKLAAASRTGKTPRVKATIALLRQAVACRAEIAATQALLTTHLGAFDRGPMTDAPRARKALSAVSDLHAALGTRLDTGRLDGLLLADAFTAAEVAEPARTVQTVLDAWEADATRAGCPRALEITLAELSEWLEDAPIAADLLDEGATAVAAAGHAAGTVTGLVNDLLARERVAEASAERRRALDEADESARRSS
jgi:hypothetical protein